jgi:hypothetical protein
MPITLNGDTGITTPTYGGAVAAEYIAPVTSFKNRIINGAMMIAQRGTSFAGLTNGSGAYITDRWLWQESGTSTAVQTASQDSSAPTGFVNSLKVLTTTAQASLAATNSYKFVQRIEGFTIADLGWGTANAQPVTLSFWVRSSLTGTFGGGLQNENADRYYIYSYTINAADTWEYKTVTIVGDTSGTWNTTNGNGIGCTFSFGTGSDYLTAPGSWGSSRADAPTGQVNVAGTLDATFYLTGVQLEKGSTATSFDYRPYGTELALCQRYYGKLSSGTTFSVGAGHNSTTTAGQLRIIVGPGFRASPSVTSSGTFTARGGGTSNNVTSISVVTFDGSYPTLSFAATVVSNNAIAVFGNAGASLELSSEL